MASEPLPKGVEPDSRNPAAAEHAAVTKLSPWSVADTVARLAAVIAARGLQLFAVIDHGGNARHLGLTLRDTKLVLFGSAAALTPIIDAAPLAALELPARVVVWEDGYQTRVSYPGPAPACIDAIISAVIAR